MVERHVIEGERHLADQRARIARFDRLHLQKAADEARDLLRLFEATQSLHVAHRDRLRAELQLRGTP